MFGNAGQQEGFGAAGLAAPEDNGGFGQTQQFSNKIKCRLVRFAVHRRSGQTQLQRAAMQSGQLGAGRARLNMEGEQQAAVGADAQAGQGGRRISGAGWNVHASIEAYFHG